MTAAHRSVGRVDQADDLGIPRRGQRFRSERLGRDMIGNEDENRAAEPRLLRRRFHKLLQRHVGVGDTLVHFRLSFRQTVGVTLGHDERVVRSEREGRREERFGRFGQRTAHIL